MYFCLVLVLSSVAGLTGCATAPGSSVASGDSPTYSDAQAKTLTPGSGAARPAKPAKPFTGISDQGYDGSLSSMDRQTANGQVVTALSPPVDLWDRIRRGFAMPDLQSDLVKDREQWYTSRPDYIYRMTERSKKYLFHIVEELELRNMPTELALLPFIESAYNPQAVSSAKAAGMWQFMPATGKYFELKQNAFRDDRRDVLASTRAALDYLQKLYGMFGDWHLALAAYNWGEGSVGRAIAKNQRLGQPATYSGLNMPMETRFYVPKLQAIKNIVAQPELFKSTLPLIENHPYFQSVTIERDIDVALAAKLADVPLDDFKALNPSVNRPVILAAGTPQILLPWDNAEVFLNNLQAYSGGRLASWTVWIAPTTMRPSDAAKRVGMTEAELRSVNAVPARVVIRAGSTLLVPRAANVQDDVAGKVADNGQLTLAPEVVSRRSIIKAGKGETVATIARARGLPAAQVAQWNKVAANASFKPGQPIILILPPAAPRKAVTFRTGPAKSTVRTSNPPVRKAASRAAKPAKPTKPAKSAKG
ncbi:MAG: transglycosylase SLT domain-containing protein [Candidatus Saccharibacteria bacterium]|nr:transglycosylase SLT domain-containing protein [Rhodoferax sp.]